ncbi:hypothetical protein [Vibrio vulnificus]|uniref:hypothetical protein n=1 Tax=Vibrio vulnificus TaxID=672 RepID=UPI0010D88C82|nr:hypothetical protein [Vibrio vulnificus]RZR37612.1 hypothetical protein D8T58_24200 [Vibrio vulnificus]
MDEFDDNEKLLNDQAIQLLVELGYIEKDSAQHGVLKLSIKFEVRHFLQMRMNILQWCSIPKSFAWARI